MFEPIPKTILSLSSSLTTVIALFFTSTEYLDLIDLNISGPAFKTAILNVKSEIPSPLCLYLIDLKVGSSIEIGNSALSDFPATLAILLERCPIKELLSL